MLSFSLFLMAIWQIIKEETQQWSQRMKKHAEGSGKASKNRTILFSKNLD